MEFPLLSEQPGSTGVMPASNPVDQMAPVKCTPTPPGHEQNQREFSQLIHQTEAMINTGFKNVRHVNAITLELKLLLEHEQQLLQQAVNRIDKFRNLKEENKRKAIEWEDEYKKKLPEYDSYTIKLVNAPRSQPLSVEGVSAPVQQKMLLQIVSRTSNIADRVVVSLSMVRAVTNDIDFTLGGLKGFCNVMLKRISGWLRELKTLECEQKIVLDRWNRFHCDLEGMKSKTGAVGMTAAAASGTSLVSQLKPYEERLKRIEDAIYQMGGPSFGTYCQNIPPIDSGPQTHPVERPVSLGSQTHQLKLPFAPCSQIHPVKQPAVSSISQPRPVKPPVEPSPKTPPGNLPDVPRPPTPQYPPVAPTPPTPQDPPVTPTPPTPQDPPVAPTPPTPQDPPVAPTSPTPQDPPDTPSSQPPPENPPDARGSETSIDLRGMRRIRGRKGQ